MSDISIRKLSKLFAHTRVLHDIDLDIGNGEFVALVGPSGCGKSTLLRMIAGLEDIDGGEIRLAGERINDVAPRDRNIAMVFQNYALYPHMTVERNLGFALSLQGLTKQAIRSRVQDVARLLDLGELLERFPRQLSGGQRQRVAMGRAIIREPRAFLFDEPLSNLDARLRVQMRTEIRALHQRLGTTTVYVTHDQVEAMTMADRIVVMRDGRIEQSGSPLELYDRPANAFVAGFIGSPAMNLIPGRLALDGQARVLTDDGLVLPLERAPRAEAGTRVLYGTRPEHFSLADPQAPQAEVLVVEPTGSDTQIALRLGRHELLAAFRERLDLRPGDRLPLAPLGRHAHVFAADSGQRID